MKRKLIIVFLFTGLSLNLFAQLPANDLLLMRSQLATATHDSSRLRLLFQLSNGCRFSNVDSSLLYADLGIKLATKLNLPVKKAEFLSLKGATLLESGRLPEALQFQFEALNISDKLNDTSSRAYALNRIGNTYMELADFKRANDYYFHSRDLFRSVKDTGMYYNEVSNIGNIYELMQMPDSALYYQQQVYDFSKRTNDRNSLTRPEMMFRMGNAYNLKGDKAKALQFYKRGIAEAYIDNDIRDLTMNNLFLAKLYKEMNLPDSSLKYAYSTMQTAASISFKKGLYEASVLISELFKNKKQYDSAFKYLSIANAEKDFLTGTKRLQDLQRIVLDEQQRERELEFKRIAVENKVREYSLLSGLGIIMIIAWILYRNNKQKQKTNKALESTLLNLKSTQVQLIQSEKMASLGELTAGIAHEIQNPLNFVNNFSELNKELIEELEEEADNGNIEQVKTIAQNIKENEQKINHHGRRADSIVKGMLQHSRAGSGKKEPVKLNALVDENLRLSYHGLRAKDKTFNATINSQLDEHVGEVNIIQQDISRALLNVFNNAFYAVNEKKKILANGYQPTAEVKTRRINGKVEISVSDNGNGIPQNIMGKIFQPFFTTKPTGQGTGLGLSLSYDIITKEHNGTIKVESKEGEGTTFVIQLPL